MKSCRGLKFQLCLMSCCALVAGQPGPTASSKASQRPKVGLVLGGGGALGLSHVGVLKVLEEQHIPIDYIAGTSMGSIIAGWYAAGMSPEEIESLLVGIDWDNLMNDETPRRDLVFRRKQDDQRYLFEMGLNWGGPKMGTGLAAGQKFNNLMEYATLRSAGTENFDQLPVPFRAVATDLESGLPYVIDHGRLSAAMRASMAVPGVFTACTIDGHLLVDGGIVDNLPVDLVRGLGADVIIAVDVGAQADQVDRDKLNTLGGILSRTYGIAQRPGQLEQFKRAEIGIQPDLAPIKATQFDRAREIIPRGEEAARVCLPALRKLSVSSDEFRRYLARQRRAPPDSILINEIVIQGESRVSEASIRGRIRSRPHTPFDMDTVRGDLGRLYGIGEFEQVIFRLQPTPDGLTDLHYETTEKTWGPLYLKYGLQLRSDFNKDSDWVVLLNATRMSLNDYGAEWRNELQLGSRISVLSEFYQPLDLKGMVFLAPKVEYRSEIEDRYEGKNRMATYEVDELSGSLELGLQMTSFAELRVGPRWGRVKAEVETGDSDLPKVDSSYAGMKAAVVIDRQDRTLFAREGFYIETTAFFIREGLGSDWDYNKVEVAARKQFSFDDHTFTLGIQAGSSLGSELPPSEQFALGGPFGFAGLAENQFRGSALGVGSVGYRYRLAHLPSQLGRGLYTISRLDIGNVWPDDVDTGDLRFGGALGLGADTVIGPVFLAYGRSDGGFGRIYFSLGLAF